MIITSETINAYADHLAGNEKSPGTIDDYKRSIRRLAEFLDERELTPELAIEWKQSLTGSSLAAATVNLCISAANGLFRFIEREDCLLKRLRVQQKPYRESSRDLSQDEYKRLVNAAKRTGKKKEALILETICGTGIRVSELHYITVEAAEEGQAEVSLKGKIRVIMIPEAVRKKLLFYAERNGIRSGEIFLTSRGTPMDRRQVWAALKTLGPFAGVKKTKVFPHNLRHLFAVSFYKAYRDIAALADVLGHSSINTTRIYLKTTGDEHRRRLNELGLVS